MEKSQNFSAASIDVLIPLDTAKIQPGENVLVLGATGPLGQIALQLSRAMGAGRVVGAARSLPALEHLKSRALPTRWRSLAKATTKRHLRQSPKVVSMSCSTASVAILREAALRTTRIGARMISIGVQAGETMVVPPRDFRVKSNEAEIIRCQV